MYVHHPSRTQFSEFYSGLSSTSTDFRHTIDSADVGTTIVKVVAVDPNGESTQSCAEEPTPDAQGQKYCQTKEATRSG